MPMIFWNNNSSINLPILQTDVSGLPVELTNKSDTSHNHDITTLTNSTNRLVPTGLTNNTYLKVSGGSLVWSTLSSTTALTTDKPNFTFNGSSTQHTTNFTITTQRTVSRSSLGGGENSWQNICSESVNTINSTSNLGKYFFAVRITGTIPCDSLFIGFVKPSSYSALTTMNRMHYSYQSSHIGFRQNSGTAFITYTNQADTDTHSSTASAFTISNLVSNDTLICGVDGTNNLVYFMRFNSSYELKENINISLPTNLRAVDIAPFVSWSNTSSSYNYKVLTYNEILSSISPAMPTNWISIFGNGDVATDLSAYYTSSSVDSLLAAKSSTSHTHLMTDSSGLVSALAGKSDTGHTHLMTDSSGLITALSGKASSSHTHSISDITSLTESLNAKAADNHTHDSRYYTETEMDSLLNAKASSSHNHDERYYTETEINTTLAGYSLTTHHHDSDYSLVQIDTLTITLDIFSGGGSSSVCVAFNDSNITNARIINMHISIPTAITIGGYVNPRRVIHNFDDGTNYLHIYIKDGNGVAISSNMTMYSAVEFLVKIYYI